MKPVQVQPVQVQPVRWGYAADPEVRPYGLTGGRTSPRLPLRPESLLQTGTRTPPGALAPEHQQAVRLCRDGGTSVAEIAAGLGLPLQVTKIIASDLIACGALDMPTPAVADGRNPQLLEAILVHLERL
ncbi:DUF742 domain-containing protein [Streptomyces sp. NPDC051018]|uniref:DUF742 domain-containing protein n=1 Tax=Streptomyces sp. NPDC051018 TaxID=3365639 RepID=UPI0037898FC5